MKQILLSSALLLHISIAFSQICDFEDLGLPIDTFAIGINGDTSFYSSGIDFHSSFDTTFNYWSGGFAMSTMRDTSTGNFSNLYSARNTSLQSINTYAVANLGEGPLMISMATPTISSMLWESLEISNTTYAYKSMLNGDAFAKKFGGVTGDDPDYFFVRIYAKQAVYRDSLDFYLADFRFSDNSQDYIIDDWAEVDLSSFPSNTALEFKLFSSDTGAFGINTPLFFALDNIKYSVIGGLNDINHNEFKVFSDGVRIQLDNSTKANYSVYDVQGRLLYSLPDYSGSSLNIKPKNQLLIITKETSEGVSTKKILH